ncbi:DUF2946 family protein [Geminicoccaceae bacterium 1502E]|nr:DUF2946 family protein [Geminicoccaceae bacterium 1502E]
MSRWNALRTLGRALAVLAGLSLLLPPGMVTPGAALPSLAAVVLCTGDGPRLVQLPKELLPPGEAPADNRQPHQHCVFCLTAEGREPALPLTQAPLPQARPTRRRTAPRRRRWHARRRLFLLPLSRAPPPRRSAAV